MDRAAERHFKAAECLYEKTGLHCVAGYLYGIAAECAIKHIMRHAGLTAHLPKGKDKNNPMYAHFPSLKILLRNYIQGRMAQVLRPVLDDQFMQDWDISMRYTATRSVSKKKVDHWRNQARSIIITMRGQ
jgi:hypothetical protein